ncbi:putative pentatricopeptide repeat-containing protein At3g16710, mitochondrial [Humulus lupulus]|uniref:putative pentatricopeptide repeat-containing protein At3g16710, mitochondrial n=1 Tax=Humulus lupulus TaxID=3486 RepID=UPI002B41867F|nr:putative pentatricopeptide repeat-containing protein At3g16710, mitochondrial [Humulus lupulus]
MAVKVSSLAFSKRLPFWVISSAYISSISCASSAEIFPETNPSNSFDFEHNIQFLRNKLVPDSLIRVLDSTSDLSSAVKIFKWASLQNRFHHTADTYFQIILKLGLAGHIQEMEGFCQNMVRDRIPGTEEAFSALIDAFVKHGKLSEAKVALVNMNLGCHNPSIETFNALMGALVNTKRDFQDVLFVYKEMVKAGVSPTIDTLNYLLEVLVETDRLETALDQFKRINKKGCLPNARSFEILIKGLIAQNRVDEAVKTLYEMFESECHPDLRFFSCTIPLFCQENRPKEGIKLLSMMKDSNFVPDLSTYTVLIKCLCEDLLLDEVISLLEEAIEIGSALPNDSLVDVINMFCELEKVDEALKFLEDKHILETSPYNALLEGCYCTGKLSTAKDVLWKMSERDIDDSNSWNILIRWVCEQEGIRKASELVGRMVLSSFTPNCDTYSALVIGNCKLSKYKDALELFYKIKAKCWVLDTVSYATLVERLCSLGWIQEAAEVFSYMSKKGCSLHSSSFNMLIKGVCDTGHLSEALRLRQLAYYSGTSCTSSTYTMIMHGLLTVDKPKDVSVVFSQMLVEGINLDLEAYCILIQSMSLQNQIKKGTLLFNIMINEGLVPDSERLLHMLSWIANQSQLSTILCSINKLICREEMTASISNVLINGLWKEGHKREANRILDLMLEKGLVPDAKTHGLLVGTNGREQVYSEAQSNGNSATEDTVSNILIEGLENM